MSDQNAKQRILEQAVRIFSAQGFHGTSMREIATASDCSLPTLYYHYKSKNELFEEIVVHQFLEVTKRMNAKLDLSANPVELYFQVLRTRKELEGFDREVFKMALKVWLGFEGDSSAREAVAGWENRRAEANRSIIARVVEQESRRDDITDILIHYMESVINRIILLEEDVDDDKLKRQIALLFELGI